MRALLLLMICTLAGQAGAHDLGVAKILLMPVDAQRVQLQAKLPEKMDPAAPVVPENCQASELDRIFNGRRVQLVTWEIHCSPDIAQSGASVRLEWEREGALVVTKHPDGTRRDDFIDADAGVVILHIGELIAGSADIGGTLKRYLFLGVEHILIGIDHLAFVLALCLIASGWRLVRLVTAFTLGHSLTLAAATLGWVSVPVPPMEASIALSIAFVAREVLRPVPARGQGFWLVAAFGMLHGLGFASVLSEIGVASNHLLTGLLAFNLGVELGQLLFIAAVLLVIRVSQKLVGVPMERFRAVAAFGIGSIAMFWMFDRVAGFF